MRFLVRVVIIIILGKWMEGLVSSIDGFAPEIESPINEIASEIVDFCVLNNHSPFSHR
jgi:hypothetical protein